MCYEIYHEQRGEAGDYCDWKVFGCKINVLDLENNQFENIVKFLANLNNWKE